MTDESVKNFNKRNPARPTYEEPARKRSSQIALLLMGAVAVGGGAYALMPSERCDPNRPSVEQPGCRQGSLSSSSGGHYFGGSGSSNSSSSRTNFTSSGASSSTSSIAGKSSSTVTRHGFGSFGSHFSGGG